MRIWFFTVWLYCSVVDCSVVDVVGRKPGGTVNSKRIFEAFQHLGKKSRSRIASAAQAGTFFRNVLRNTVGPLGARSLPGTVPGLNCPGLLGVQPEKSPEMPHFCLAKGRLEPSLPVPCLESLEKQRHGKPLPNASKSLVRAKSSVGNKANATCFNARTASASAGWVKLLWFPPLTSRMSKRTCPSIEIESWQ